MRTKWKGNETMSENPKYYIVEESALPDIFLRVAEVKRMLDSGETAKVSDATRKVGISRSAYYKYKDSILPFQNLMAGRIITFQMTLRDEVGLLSQLLRVFSEAGANILTINQTIPVGGIASVTVSAETTDLNCSVETLLGHMTEPDGVYRAEILAG